MKSFSVTVEIKAKPSTVWALLTKTGNWSDWHPSINRVEGKLALGEKIALVTEAYPSSSFTTKVTEFIPNQHMVWSSGMPIGLLKDVHIYTLEAKPHNTTSLTLKQEFRGFLMAFVGNSIPDMQPSLEKVAEAIKLKCNPQT